MMSVCNYKPYCLQPIAVVFVISVGIPYIIIAIFLFKAYAMCVCVSFVPGYPRGKTAYCYVHIKKFREPHAEPGDFLFYQYHMDCLSQHSLI